MGGAGRRGVVVKPTGTGKTEIALSIIAHHRAAALVVAPLRDLMYQWQRRIKKGLGFEAGRSLLPRLEEFRGPAAARRGRPRAD